MKSSIIHILFIICVFVFIAIKCSKEYSCKNCEGGEVDTVGCTDCVPTDTTSYNELISRYDFVLNNGDVKKIYFCVKTKYHPGHYYITDSIPVQSSDVSHYNGSFNVKNYPDFINHTYVKNDTFPVFYQIRYIRGDIWETDSTTLVY